MLPHVATLRDVSKWIIWCYPLIDVKSDQRLLVMNGSVGKLKPVGERRSIIIPDNPLLTNENLMGRLGSLGGMCTGEEEREWNSPSPPLKSFAANQLFCPTCKNCVWTLLLPSKPCYLNVITLDHLDLNLNLNVWSAKGSTAHLQQICAVLVLCALKNSAVNLCWWNRPSFRCFRYSEIADKNRASKIKNICGGWVYG